MSDSLWKKDISLRRKAQPAQPEPEPIEAITAVEGSVELPTLPAGDYGWLTANFDPDALPDAMPTVAAPAVEVPSPASVVIDQIPDVPAIEPPQVDVPALVAAVAASADAEAEAKTPIWKKELSFSRKPKEPKAAKAPKAPKEPKARKEPQAPKEPKEPKDSQPFWKKELSLSRAPKEPKEPKEASQPFWKKELSFSRAPKEAKAPKEPDAPNAPKAPKEKKPPIWKRELKLERGPKGPKVAKPTKQKAPKSAASKGAVVGLKIGASQVAAARVTNHGQPHLLQYAREPLPDGVVVAGELRDVEGLAQALKALFGKNKLPKKGVRLGIANNRIGVRTFEISGIDEPRQLANAIRFRAQETLPIPLEEAVLDWQVLAEWRDEETGHTVRRVLLVVAYRELVDRYILACKKAGIRLAGIDLEAFAMLRALNAPPGPDAPEATGAQVVVNVGHDRSTFAVSNGRVCEFTRVLSWGGQSLSVAIARVLDMTPSEATPIKHALSLVAQAEPPEDISPEALGAARTAVANELQAFARELVSSLRFYQNQPGSLGIGEIVLTGGTAHMPGLAEELNRLVGVSVRVGDPLNRVVVPKKFREPTEYPVGSLTVAIGLGIED